MKQPTLGNPQNTIAVLQKYNFTFQKKFGQNFLIDPMYWIKLSGRQRSGRRIVYWRSGRNRTMTQYLACAAGRVIAVEIDRA